jgi:MFS superfamily sulfate permease-like transporter
MKAMLEEILPPPQAILLDASGQDELDITSAEVLKSFLAELKEKGIGYYVAGLHITVREFGQKMGLLALIPEDHLFPTVDAAVRFFETSDGQQ